MPQRKTTQALDLGDDPGIERGWRLQRAGRVLLAAIVAAALAGVLGHGPASRRVLVADGTRIDYQNPVRQGAPTRVEIRRAAGRGDEVTVALDSGYVTAMRLRSVVPPPLRVVGGGGTTTFVFAARDGSLDAVFEFEPPGVGVRETASTVAGRAAGRLRHVVLP
ncbi:MAG: hypothetical protein KJ018_01650 [Burkholderiales bacterium]|nr:hypothetical protein [Burkholderiales bacterium]GIK85205.1 MAG: hypothetical protein BroJett026_06860 [Betaproteobacteria bacterium]